MTDSFFVPINKKPVQKIQVIQETRYEFFVISNMEYFSMTSSGETMKVEEVIVDVPEQYQTSQSLFAISQKSNRDS